MQKNNKLNFAKKGTIINSTIVEAFMKFIFLLLLTFTVFGNELDEIRRLTKCYSIMSRDSISPQHPLSIKVKNHELSGTDACMKIFNLAKFTNNGEIEKIVQDGEKFQKFQTIISNKCLSCHSGTSRNFSNLHTEKDWLDSKYITPGSAQSSKLYRMLKGAGVNTLEETMPKNSSKLSDEDLLSIKDWIDSVSIGAIDVDADGRSLTAKNVLKTFNDFHRTWFANHDLNGALDGCSPATVDLLDSGEMAYYATRSMFSNNDFKDIVTSDETLMGVRSSNYPPSNRLLSNIGVARKVIIGASKGASLADAEQYEVATPPIVERGLLVGIKERPSYEMSGLFNHSSLFDDPNRVDIFDHMKAGAIGSSPYVIMNSGFSRQQRADGALRLRRRWSRSVINDVLCRDVPVIRTTDAIKFLDQTGKSPLSFRGGISCMQCHATMDPMARGLRNVHNLNSTNSCNGAYGHPFTYLHQVTPSMPEHENEWSGWIDNADTNFYKRPPVGNFLFRSADGNLIDMKFEDIDELGDILGETDDLYYCAVKRYVYFLTGIDVPLFDPGDINKPEISKSDEAVIAYIKKLAKEFKSSQSQESLIKKIISSDIFLAK